MTSGEIILSADFRLEEAVPDELLAQVRELGLRRREKQPIQYPSAGSFFKRPSVGYAAQLIDQAGLKGLSVGGAQVSRQHAGFIINTGGATAKDVLTLMKKIQEKVFECSGIMLENEVRLIGFPS